MQEALQFFSRLALLCERNCLALQDFTGELGDVAALDLGCAVGGGCFELARAFSRVVGVDSSAHFIRAAQVIHTTPYDVCCFCVSLYKCCFQFQLHFVTSRQHTAPCHPLM